MGLNLVFREFLSGPALPANKAQLILSSIDQNRHEGTITLNDRVVNSSLRRCATDVVITKVNEDIRNFKKAR